MTTLAFDYLSQNDPKITFIHSFPGLVRTDIFAKHTASEDAGWVWRITLPVVKGLFALLMMLLGTDPKESGERQAFILTSERFGKGIKLVSDKSVESPPPAALVKLREEGWAGRIWEFTVAVFEKATGQ